MGVRDLLLDFLNNKTINNPNYLFYLKYALPNSSQSTCVPNPSVCTLGRIPQEVVNSFLTCVPQASPQR